MSITDRSSVSGQVCQVHGDPADLVICPDHKCQSGRLPQWWGTGIPAGTRRCETCEGQGWMRRDQAQHARLTVAPHRRSSPPCICHRIGRAHG